MPRGLPVTSCNALLARLPHNELVLLRSRASRIQLREGAPLPLHEPDGTTSTCLPETAILSLSHGTGGRQYEVALIGREGAIGWPGLLTGLPFLSTRVCHRGTALLLPAQTMGALVSVCPELRQILLRFIQCLTAQLSTTIVSGMSADADARVARRLLMLQDRLRTSAFQITHRQIGEALDLRRATVTDSLHRLEGQRLLRSTRGEVRILDRPGLVAAAGVCYGMAEHSYDTLMGTAVASIVPGGTSATASPSYN